MKNKRTFRELDFILTRGSPAHDEINKIKDKSNNNKINQFFKDYSHHPEVASIIYHNVFPLDYQDIKNAKDRLGCSNLEKELYWNACIFRHFSENINNFIVEKRDFERYVLLGKYDEAMGILNKIESEFGLSLWFIENKIALIDSQHGFNKQKEYTKSIVEKNNISQLTAWLTSTFSKRAEKNYNPLKFDSDIKKQIDSGDLDQNRDFGSYLIYKVNFFGSVTFKDYLSILFYENDSPLIDRYLTFVRVCQLICAQEKVEKQRKVLIKPLGVVHKTINNEAISNLFLFWNKDTKLPQKFSNENLINAYDLYTKGEYEQCVKFCLKLFENNAELSELYELSVKSSMRSIGFEELELNVSPLQKILSAMNDITIRNDRAKESLLELFKWTFIFSSFSGSSKILFYTLHEWGYLEKDNDDKHLRFDLLNGSSSNPKLGRMIPTFQLKERFFKEQFSLYQDSITNKLMEALSVGGDKGIGLIEEIPLKTNRTKKYKGHIHFASFKYEEAAKLYRGLIEDQDYLISLEASIGLIKCLLKMKHFKECVSLIVDTYLKNEYFISLLPISEIVELIVQEDTSGYAKDFSVAIIFYLYSRHVTSKMDVFKGMKYEECLRTNGVSRPSHLFLNTQYFEMKKFIFFLENICVPEIMDGSIEFDNQEEIERERILICQNLIKENPLRKDIYSGEIRTLSLRLTVDSAIREIEESKIYVNEEGIKKSLERELEDSYGRYQEFLSEDQDSLEILVISVDDLLDRNYDRSKMTSEKDKLFESMFMDLANRFISSNEYGLDGYVSVRIRHGTLSGQLRCSLEAEKLITQKQAATKKYIENKYWKTHFKNLEQNQMRVLMESLNSFSKRIDDLIDKIKNKWIQNFNANDNPDGLFDVFPNPIEIKFFQKTITVNTTYQEFLDRVFQELWSKTEVCLQNIRELISGDYKLEFNQAFTELNQSINQLKPFYQISDLEAKINSARTNIQNELDKVASWFTRSKLSESHDFEASLLIDVVREQIKNIYPNSKLNYTLGIENNCVLQGRTFKDLIDIVFILFDNILKHSKFGENIPGVKLTFKRKDGNLYLEIENSLKENSISTRKMKEVKELNSKIRNEISLEKVSLEGGSGFYKIVKIIKIDLQCDYKFNFEITTANTFKTVIEFEGNALLA